MERASHFLIPSAECVSAPSAGDCHRTPAERSAPTAGEHVLDTEAGPGSDSDAVAEFFKKRIPAVIEGKQQFCGTWNIHAAEYKTGFRA